MSIIVEFLQILQLIGIALIIFVIRDNHNRTMHEIDALDAKIDKFHSVVGELEDELAQVRAYYEE